MSSIVISPILAALVVSLALAACSGPSTVRVNFPLAIKKEMELRTPSVASAVAWSPDGSRIAATIDYGHAVIVWDGSGHQVSRFDTGATGPDLDPSLAFLAGASQVVTEYAGPRSGNINVALVVHDVASGQFVRDIDGPFPGLGDSNRPNGFRVSSDQSLVILAYVVAQKDVNAAIIDTSDGKLVQGYAIEKGALALNFFDGGREVVVGSIDGVSTILDPMKETPVGQFQAAEDSQATRGNVTVVGGSPDGRLIFLGQEAQDVVGGHVLRSADGARIADFPLHRDQSIRGAEWDPQDRYVAFLDGYEGLVLWRPTEPRPSFEKTGVPANSMSFALSPDGNRIAVAGPSGLVIYAVH